VFTEAKVIWSHPMGSNMNLLSGEEWGRYKKLIEIGISRYVCLPELHEGFCFEKDCGAASMVN